MRARAPLRKALLGLPRQSEPITAPDVMLEAEPCGAAMWQLCNYTKELSETMSQTS